jgi:vancomycin resistance protein YoaR
MSPATPVIRPSVNRRVIWPIAGVAALGAAWGGFELYHSNRALPGVVAAGIPIGGLTLPEAVAKLRSAKLEPPVIAVKAGQQTIKVLAPELGWRADFEGTVKTAMEIGRNSDFITNVSKRFDGNKTADLQAKVDPKTFRNRLDALAKPFEIPAQNAALVLASGQYTIRADKTGRGIDFENAVKAFQTNPLLRNLELTVTDLPAAIKQADLEELKTQANAVLRPLKLIYPAPTGKAPLSKTLQQNEVANLFFVEQRGLRIDEKAVGETLRGISNSFDRDARDARYVRQGGAFVKRESRDGYAMDIATAKKELRTAILESNTAEVKLPVVITPAKITSASIPDPKSLTLLGSSTTRYYGSSFERVTNAAIAAAKLDGYVVPAGETFSFNEAVGEISRATGFVEGLIISGGRTAKGVGGGVCQASTTAFAALYRAGLPVVERNQHSYKVRWYDDVLGLDAAVYYPNLDLRMKNDTPGPLLVRSTSKGATMTVQLYGVSDGRKVGVSRPRILSRTPHPPARTVFNGSLPFGARKQVDYAVDGYRVTVGRSISKPSGANSETLFTNYRPWRAIYEVGPTYRAPVIPRANRVSPASSAPIRTVGNP